MGRPSRQLVETSATIDQELLVQLDAIAVERDTSRSSVIRDMLRRGLRDYNQEKLGIHQKANRGAA